MKRVKKGALQEKIEGSISKSDETERGKRVHKAIVSWIERAVQVAEPKIENEIFEKIKTYPAPKNLDTLVVPPTPPENTSTYGMKLEPNDKIGV